MESTSTVGGTGQLPVAVYAAAAARAYAPYFVARHLPAAAPYIQAADRAVSRAANRAANAVTNAVNKVKGFHIIVDWG